jgi:hypothetical protein
MRAAELGEADVLPRDPRRACSERFPLSFRLAITRKDSRDPLFRTLRLVSSLQALDDHYKLFDLDRPARVIVMLIKDRLR